MFGFCLGFASIVEIESVENIGRSHFGDGTGNAFAGIPVNVLGLIASSVLVEVNDTDSSVGVFAGERDFLVDDVEGIRNRGVGVHDLFSFPDDLTLPDFPKRVKGFYRALLESFSCSLS